MQKDDRKEQTAEMIDLSAKIKFKSKFGKSFDQKFNKLHTKYELDKKKYIVLIISIFIVSIAFITSSYAYLTYTSKTDNDITITSGKLLVTLGEKENVISLNNALPMKDETGTAQENSYKFTVKNTGEIPAKFNILLNSFCKAGEIYKINNKKIEVDKCISDKYINIGLKRDKSDFYQVVTKKDSDKYIIDTGYLNSGESVTYEMKIWLSVNTPNEYNGKNGNNIYIGRLGIEYEQGV